MADAGAARTVIIVAPSFAPASNPPTQRVRFFARHLPTFGWTPIVLTVEPRYYEERLDPEIDALLPPGLEIVRTGAWRAGLTRPVGIGDLGLRAYPQLRAALRALCPVRRPDVVLFVGPPWYPFLLGPGVRRAYGIPYVLDYIDPWVNAMGADGRWWTKAFWARQLALRLEPLAVRQAAHVVAVSAGTAATVRARCPELTADRCTEVPYGLEPDDFVALRARPRPNPFWRSDDGAFHLAYVGAMLPRGYDTLRALFAAVAALRRANPDIGARLRLHFIGTTYDPRPPRQLVWPVADAMGLADIVTEHAARVPYLDALNAMCSADALLALGSSERHYTASKIYPSVLTGRPLLAIYHAESSVCDVVRRTGAGVLVTYDDAHPAGDQLDRIGAALAHVLERRMAEAPRSGSAARAVAALTDFTAESMTARLAAVLDASVTRPPAASGRQPRDRSSARV